MSGQSDELQKLVESVADGESIDWDDLERAALDEASRQLVHHLRLVAGIAEVHRTQIDDDTVAEDAVETAPASRALPSESLSEKRRILPRVGGSPLPGAEGVWGHLLLVRKIGEGSFGEVYQAHDTWLDHPVALKLLKREAERRMSPSQLLHEARKLARVRHLNVVTVHGADRHNGRVGFWMDYVDGETLAARVAKGRLSPGEAVSVGQEVCRALAAVHQAKLIHRDVKAQNVMRTHDGGRIILMDFGAGEFIEDESVRARAQGTPLYLAPELLRGGEASVRSDIYAVGVLLYHLVTGRFPVEAPTQADLAEAHSRGERRRLRDERADLPESFISIVERALDPNPERRYASAGEMEAKLSGEPSTRPVPVVVPPKPESARWVDYLKMGAVAAAVAVVLTGTLGFIAARFFEVVLQIDRDFWLGFVETFGLGLSGLLPYLVFWLFGAAVFGALAGMRLLLPKRVSGPWNRGAASAASWDGVKVATFVFLLGALCWVLLNFVWHRELFATLYALRDQPPTAPLDFSILGPVRNEVRRDHLVVSAYLSMALGLAAWLWFPKLERQTANRDTVKLLRWGTLAVALIVVVWDVMPRRILWETYPVAEFEEQTWLVIGSTKDEDLLYAPDREGRPRIRVPRNAAGLALGGDKRALFGRAEVR